MSRTVGWGFAITASINVPGRYPQHGDVEDIRTVTEHKGTISEILQARLTGCDPSEGEVLRECTSRARPPTIRSRGNERPECAHGRRKARDPDRAGHRALHRSGSARVRARYCGRRWYPIPPVRRRSARPRVHFDTPRSWCLAEECPESGRPSRRWGPRY